MRKDISEAPVVSKATSFRPRSRKTQHAGLSPKPDSLTHPDSCTAVVSCPSGNLVVKGIKLVQPATPSADLSPCVRGIFSALPKGDMVRQDDLIKAFQRQHPVVDCRKKDG